MLLMVIILTTIKTKAIGDVSPKYIKVLSKFGLYILDYFLYI